MSTSADIRKTLINNCADEIMREIHNDMESDYRNSKGERMPADVGSFSELHDYCDANMYLIDFVPETKVKCDCKAPAAYAPVDITDSPVDHADDCATHIAWDAYMQLCDDVSNEVDARLRAEALILNTGERCKCSRLARYVGSAGGNVHIDDLSQVCE